MPVFRNPKTGKWDVSLNYKDAFDVSRHTTKRGFAKKTEAEQYEHNFFVNLRDDPSITFKQLVQQYIDYCSIRRKENTIYNKNCLINKHLLPYFGNMKVCDIKPKTVIRWQEILSNSKRQYTDTYIYTLNTMLGGILNFAMRTQNLKTNPLTIVGKTGKYRRRHDTIWAVEDFNRFIDALKDEKLNRSNQIKRTVDTTSLIVGFNILFYGGLRLGELLALTSNDIDFKYNTIRITKSYNRLLQQYVIGQPKTDNSIRVIDLPSSVMSLLKQYISCLPENYPADNRIFYALNKNNLRRALKSTAQLIGLPMIRVHDLRHAHASLLFTLGIPAKAVSERLGHSNISTTLDIYTHIAKRNSIIGDKLDQIIDNK